MSHDVRCRAANRFGDGFDCICGEPSPFVRHVDTDAGAAASEQEYLDDRAADACDALDGDPCDCGRHHADGVGALARPALTDREVEIIASPHALPAAEPPAVNPKEIAAGGEGRIPWQALPVRPLVGAALAMGEGAHKYGRHNYRKTRIKSSVYFDALLRHFFAWWEGEDIDPDSGLHHIDKAIACLLVLRDAQLRGMSDDDRPPTCAPGWIKAAGKVFGEMRAKLAEQFGAPKAPARADDK